MLPIYCNLRIVHHEAKSSTHDRTSYDISYPYQSFQSKYMNVPLSQNNLNLGINLTIKNNTFTDINNLLWPLLLNYEVATINLLALIIFKM